MKRIVILFFILSAFLSSYSQDCCDRVEKQAVEKDSLKRVILSREDSINHLNDKIGLLKSKYDKAKSDSSEFKKLKDEKEACESQLKKNAATIDKLSKDITIKDKGISDCKLDGEQTAQRRFKEGQQEVYAQIEKDYDVTKSFDDIIKFTTKESIERDLALIANSGKGSKRLQDLYKYYNAQSILTERFSEQNVQIMQIQLRLITEKSDLLEKLKTNLENYKMCNEGLKTTINKIMDIDKNETGNSDKTQRLKLDHILSELSSYIFNYEFNFNDYPYLSNIVIEIIKRKQRNANADILDLSQKF